MIHLRSQHKLAFTTAYWLPVIGLGAVLGCGSSGDATLPGGTGGAAGGDPGAGGSVGGGGGATCPTGTNLCSGACVDTTSDLSNCGACGIACSVGTTCVGGQCLCAGGLTSCAGACTDTTADPNNCGMCGTVCGTGAICTSGVCQCQNGLTSCTGSCVNTQSDGNNCGACGQVCPSGQVCSLGTCSATCAAGLTQCGSSCVDVATDAAHCGNCETTCPSGQSCVAATCSCPVGQTACGGVCVDVATDATNCGSCGTVCASGQVCQGGSCACATGLTVCGQSCVNTLTDAMNCGSCGNQCTAGAACSAGSCVGGGTGGATGTGGSTAGGGTSATGGASTGGAATGGSATGGAATGGASTGGAATGGANTGGAATGGASTGGAGTGGSTEPGTCQPNCGSHKWACWPMPNPRGSGLPNEASYTDQGDYVHDDITCLDWQKSAPSQSGGYTWDEANQTCESLSLGGFDDWRLPTRIEMMSIMDWTSSGAKIDTSAFPGAAGGFHKTASIWFVDTARAWAFNLSDGITSNNYFKTTAAAIRCVRGTGSGEPLDEFAEEPPNHYTVIADGEVQDNYTGLTWQQGDSQQYMSWNEAVQYCANLSLNGQSWRLPSIREISTLVDESTVAPAINEEMFPGTIGASYSNDWYWASHQETSNRYGWAINFDDGFTGFNAGSSGSWNYFTAGYAKCVR